MGTQAEVTGMIIKTMGVGETDVRLTLFTKERGKMFVFARGAKRPRSPLMGLTRVFTYGKFLLFEGRNSFRLAGGEAANYFEDLHRDMENTCYGSYFLELTDYYTREFLADPPLLTLLYYALRALTRPALPKDLVRRIFELKCMVLNGEYDPRPAFQNESAAYTWEYIAAARPEELFRFVIEEEALGELGKVLDAMIKKYIDRSFHSLEILKSMGG